jgi:hypothetical protein
MCRMVLNVAGAAEELHVRALRRARHAAPSAVVCTPTAESDGATDIADGAVDAAPPPPPL